jgi:alkylated DNA repair dioxygenase AlkB
MEQIELTDGWLMWHPTFYAQGDSEMIYRQLLEEINWNQGKIKLFGKECLIPRLEAFYASDNQTYAYSGQKLTTNTFTPLLVSIKSTIEQSTSFHFNSLLANLYRTGNDSNGWHADNEKELGKNPVIASLSFGADRLFELQHNQTKEKIKLTLNAGSLLIMGGSMQHYWKHRIAKNKKIQSGRINLTFRTIV